MRRVPHQGVTNGQAPLLVRVRTISKRLASAKLSVTLPRVAGFIISCLLLRWLMISFGIISPEESGISPIKRMVELHMAPPAKEPPWQDPPYGVSLIEETPADALAAALADQPWKTRAYSSLLATHQIKLHERLEQISKGRPLTDDDDEGEDWNALEEKAKEIGSSLFGWLGGAAEGRPASPGGGAECWSDNDGCHGHGRCGASGKCEFCSVLYSGPSCSARVDLGISAPSARPEALRSIQLGGYDGPFVMTQTSMDMFLGHNISVDLPEKSKTLGIASPEFLQLLPKEDVFKVYNTCAIVGSSGILLYFKNGGAIDEHELVVRFNNAPTQGFEAHVGSRTTHRVCTSSNFGFRENDTEHVIQHFRTSTAYKLFVRTHRHKAPGTELRLYGLHPRFVEYVANGFPTFVCSSGCHALIIALSKCRSISLFGLQFFEEHGVPYHYFNRHDRWGSCFFRPLWFMNFT
eukprot:jgi/Mesvir1/12952/Mv05965-RA.2